ncbi:hypothetical protein R3X25_15035 [Lutibacter sp. TH_r2]|uniref:hypothetical protein n=1 Tax=Lutibacter sp. TH_r2 TaxID=3082083 RepID=UPI0029537E1B|nr:hypothetical protein [Lutibacter sp. TH_r2]MDV7188600.1 hypothetical protein [Lutibacter sp. TH_r2]
MKKIIMTTLIALLLISCNAYKGVNTHELNIGMTKKEVFNTINREPVLEYTDNDTEIYKVRKRIVRGGAAQIQQYFLYFENNKLIKIDKGERAVDKRIKIDIN